MSPTDSVLGTCELLEHILSFVPPLELLTTARCVSKYWRSMIDTSPTLQWATWRYPGIENPFQQITPTRTQAELTQFYSKFTKDVADLVRMQHHIDRKYELNPLVPLILRNFWKTLVATAVDTEDLSEETVDLVAESFFKSIEHLGIYATRPAFPSTFIYLDFRGLFRSPRQDPSSDYYLPAAGRPSLTFQPCPLKKNLKSECNFSQMLRILYEQALSSQGWGLVISIAEGSKMVKERKLKKPAADASIYLLSWLCIEFSELESNELKEKHGPIFSKWRTETYFGCQAPWSVEVTTGRACLVPHQRQPM